MQEARHIATKNSICSAIRDNISCGSGMRDCGFHKSQPRPDHIPIPQDIAPTAMQHAISIEISTSENIYVDETAYRKGHFPSNAAHFASYRRKFVRLRPGATLHRRHCKLDIIIHDARAGAESSLPKAGWIPQTL